MGIVGALKYYSALLEICKQKEVNIFRSLLDAHPDMRKRTTRTISGALTLAAKELARQARSLAERAALALG